jgi:hypothetical protein
MDALHLMRVRGITNIEVRPEGQRAYTQRHTEMLTSNTGLCGTRSH